MKASESKRERSAIYPYASWSDCIDFIKKVDSFRASQVSYEEVAERYGVTRQAYSFKARLSASRQFGLIDTSGDVIILSERAKRILYPIGNSEKDVAYECFGNPPLYSKLIELFNGSALPTEVVLSNILVNEHRIARNAKDIAAKYFLFNANEMGFVNDGVLSYGTAPDENISQNDLSANTGDINLESTPVVTQNDAPASILSPSESKYITQSIPTASGKIAQIQIPIDASEEDLWMIRDTLDIVMKRKFNIKLE